MRGSKLAFSNRPWRVRALTLWGGRSSSAKFPSSKNVWFQTRLFEFVMVSQSIDSEPSRQFFRQASLFKKCVVPNWPFRIGHGFSEHSLFGRVRSSSAKSPWELHKMRGSLVAFSNRPWFVWALVLLREPAVLQPSLFFKCVVPTLPFRIGHGFSKHQLFVELSLLEPSLPLETMRGPRLAFFQSVSISSAKFLASNDAWFHFCLLESVMVSQSITSLGWASSSCVKSPAWTNAWFQTCLFELAMFSQNISSLWRARSSSAKSLASQKGWFWTCLFVSPVSA